MGDSERFSAMLAEIDESHTEEASGCGRIRGAEMADIYAEAGYDAIVICDHRLSPGWPSPFRAETTLNFTLAAPADELEDDSQGSSPRGRPGGAHGRQRPSESTQRRVFSTSSGSCLRVIASWRKRGRPTPTSTAVPK